ncbi:MAG: caspase family protein [Abitibacteriaceae bacterium]|nr:caspase family protein [Abditibacteriaceae bacterium]
MQRNFSRVAASRVLTLALVTTGGAAVRADQAVVVGINQYPQLPGANLSGCVNDASNMGATLSQMGFNVTKLTDGQAKRQAILDAIVAVQGKIQPNERFVFSFAGHGTKHSDGKGALVVNDSAKDESTDLGADALFAQLKELKGHCKSVSVVLDSCFSGAMSRAFNRPGDPVKYRKARFYKRRSTKDFVLTAADPDTKITPEPVNNQDNTNQWDSGGQAGICYFTAASGKEVAEENDFSGTASGIFSHFVAAQLGVVAAKKAALGNAGAEGVGVRWGDVLTSVSGDVAAQTDSLQHPTVSRSFFKTLVFENNEGAPAPDPQPAPVPVWNLYNTSHADASKVSLLMTPNKAPIKVGEKFRFDTTVGTDGYLVILERGVSGKINLLFPMSRKLDDAQVKAGQTVSIPPQKELAITNDRPGTEYVKAILFTRDVPATDLLKKFNAPEGNGFATLNTGTRALGQRSRDFIMVSADDWFTSDITMQVLNADQIADNAGQ